MLMMLLRSITSTTKDASPACSLPFSSYNLCLGVPTICPFDATTSSHQQLVELELHTDSTASIRIVWQYRKAGRHYSGMEALACSGRRRGGRLTIAIDGSS